MLESVVNYGIMLKTARALAAIQSQWFLYKKQNITMC